MQDLTKLYMNWLHSDKSSDRCKPALVQGNDEFNWSTVADYKVAQRLLFFSPKYFSNHSNIVKTLKQLVMHCKWQESSLIDSPAIIHLLNVGDDGVAAKTQLTAAMCLVISDGSNRYLKQGWKDTQYLANHEKPFLDKRHPPCCIETWLNFQSIYSILTYSLLKVKKFGTFLSSFTYMWLIT